MERNQRKTSNNLKKEKKCLFFNKQVFCTYYRQSKEYGHPIEMWP